MTTYEVIQHQEVGAGGAASITFSSIPQTYTDLVILHSLQNAGAYDIIKLSFNGSAANSSSRNLRGTGSAAASSTDAYAVGGWSYNGNGSITIPNYTSSNYKSFSVDTVSEVNATETRLGIVAGLWSQTAAITSISLALNSGANFTQYSSATLIGIKQAALPTPTDVYSDSLLEEQILTSSAASVTFSNLDIYGALGYTNLQIRNVASVDGVADGSVRLRLNGDSGANYSRHFLYGNGSSVGSIAATSVAEMPIGAVNVSTTGFGAGIADIVDAFDTSKYTTIRSFYGLKTSESLIYLASGSWRNTAAITSLTIFPTSGNFIAGSRFSLYGSK